VATSDGYLFCYTIEPDGGECTLMRQYRIGPLTQEEIQQQQQNSAGQVIIAGSAGNVVNELQKLYPNLTQVRRKDKKGSKKSNFGKKSSPKIDFCIQNWIKILIFKPENKRINCAQSEK
jgi:hypothetical protein